jgi:hypothetical protein
LFFLDNFNLRHNLQNGNN